MAALLFAVTLLCLRVPTTLKNDAKQQSALKNDAKQQELSNLSRTATLGW
jgi:hypothetical protein